MSGSARFSDAIQRGATELHGLTERLERVERQLEVLYHKSGHQLVPEEISALQEIDLVVQSIAALAAYLDNLSNGVSLQREAAIEEAIQTIPLRDLAARLRGEPASSAGQGTTELF